LPGPFAIAGCELVVSALRFRMLPSAWLLPGEPVKWRVTVLVYCPVRQIEMSHVICRRGLPTDPLDGSGDTAAPYSNRECAGRMASCLASLDVMRACRFYFYGVWRWYPACGASRRQR